MVSTGPSQIWVQHILANPSAYEAKFVVHTDEEILFASEHLMEVEAWVKENQDDFAEDLLVFLVPRYFAKVRLRMLKIKSLSAGEWMPTCPVVFFLANGESTKIEMLVDSGADVTFIPLKIGERLGFVKSLGESTLTALGVGSEVSYLVRENKVQIEQTELTIHLLWGQDEAVNDVLLGRLDVFDHFDITFSQHRRKVIFTAVDENYPPT